MGRLAHIRGVIKALKEPLPTPEQEAERDAAHTAETPTELLLEMLEDVQVQLEVDEEELRKIKPKLRRFQAKIDRYYSENLTPIEAGMTFRENMLLQSTGLLSARLESGRRREALMIAELRGRGFPAVRSLHLQALVRDQVSDSTSC